MTTDRAKRYASAFWDSLSVALPFSMLGGLLVIILYAALRYLDHLGPYPFVLSGTIAGFVVGAVLGWKNG